MGLRDTIVNARDTQLVSVEVPEWGCTVYVKELSVGERMRLFDQITANPDKLPVVLSVIATLCDSDGTPVFTLDDYALVAARNHDVVIRLGKHAAEVSRLVGNAVDEAKKN